MKKGYSLLHVILIIVVTSIISGITVGVIYTRNATSTNGINYSKYAFDDNIQELLDVYGKLNDEYYKDVDKSKVVDSAINAMMEYLDESYTTYLNQNEATNLISQLNGTYDGIGITIKNSKIINVMDKSPAKRAGLLAGDIISSINGNDVEKMTSYEIASMVKNSGEMVSLAIIRDGENHIYNLKTEKLDIPSTEYYTIPNTSIGYLKISIFSNNLSKEVLNNLNKLRNENIKSLILDLRDNTGGYLDEAYNTATLFTKNGKVIYSLNEKNKITKYKDKDNDEFNFPIVILVNGATASASEILTAALKDNNNAIIIGLKTYGKGKVQHTYSLNDGSLVKYTTSTWLRPNGSCIDGIGITPDYLVENEYIMSDEDEEVIIDIIDKQYDKAVELLSN